MINKLGLILLTINKTNANNINANNGINFLPFTLFKLNNTLIIIAKKYKAQIIYNIFTA